MNLMAKILVLTIRDMMFPYFWVRVLGREKRNGKERAINNHMVNALFPIRKRAGATGFPCRLVSNSPTLNPFLCPFSSPLRLADPARRPIKLESDMVEVAAAAS